MARAWFLILLSNERNQGSLEKRVGQGKYQVSPEHLVLDFLNFWKISMKGKIVSLL